MPTQTALLIDYTTEWQRAFCKQKTLPPARRAFAPQKSRRGLFLGLVVIAQVKHPVPSRTRKLSTAAPMVLGLKPRESRSPPNLVKAHISLNDQTITDTDAGWSSPVARQAHNLKVVGSNPTPATNFSEQSVEQAAPGRLCSFWDAPNASNPASSPINSIAYVPSSGTNRISDNRPRMPEGAEDEHVIDTFLLPHGYQYRDQARLLHV